MNKHAVCLLAILCASLTLAHAKPPLDIIGEDDATGADYNSGWSDGKGSGTGFGKWTLKTTTNGQQSNAGFYIATTSEKQDLNGIAQSGKAFGLYANGTSFEVAAAFRSFDHALKAGQSFSFLMEHGDFVKKFDTDDASGASVGLTLRSSTDVDGADDYNKAARFEFGYYKSDSLNGYEIFDGDGSKAVDLPFTDGGMSVTFTLVTADTYDLEITTMADKKTVRIEGRKLGGTAGDPVKSFVVFNRNSETFDAYFNGFQILQGPKR